MNLNVYFAWQSKFRDINYDFILSCLDQACHEIENKDMLAGIYMRVINLWEAGDESKGVHGNLKNDRTGSPVITNSIRERIKKDADIFVEDWTTADVLTIPWRLRRVPFLGKFLSLFPYKNENKSNINVGIEYGIADILSPELHIKVINSYFGTGVPSDVKSELLNIKYFLASKHNADKKEDVRKKLVDDFKLNLKNCAEYALWHKDSRYWPFVTFYKQQESILDHTPNFFGNNALQQIIDGIDVKRTSNRIIRIISMSGMGKTRLVFETFSHDNGLKNRYLYCNCYDAEYRDIINAIHEIQRQKEDAILVLDNCDKDTFRRIKNFRLDYKIQNLIITIYNDIAEMESTDSYESIEMDDTELFYINSGEVNDIVENIVKSKTSSGDTIPEDIQKQILFLADGNIQLAILLREAYFKDLPESIDSRYTNEELKNKLLGAPEGSEKRIIFQSFALFNFLGIEPPYENQYKFVANNKYLTPLPNGDDAYREHQFYTLYTEKQELFDKNGSLVGIRPKALALWLAEEWFKSCSVSQLEGLIKSFDDDEVGSFLVDSMAKQIRNIAYKKSKAEYLLARLRDSHGPFSKPEAVKSLSATRLFRAFAEINPEATADILYNDIYDNSIDDLRNCLETRRNLVLTTNTLCFDKRTFCTGVKIMLRLASAENETYGNNATNEFVKLFSITLPGTEADFTARLEILRWGISKNEYRNIIAKAIGRALSTGNAVYWNGAEKQGFVKKQNYVPKTYKEIYDYQHECYNIVIQQLKNVCDDSEVFEKIVCSTVYDYFKFNMDTPLFDCIEKIIAFEVQKNDGEWPEMRDVLQEVKGLYYDRLTDELKDLLDQYLNMITKVNFSTKFKDVAVSFRYAASYDGKNESFQKLYEKAKIDYYRLAEEFVNQSFISMTKSEKDSQYNSIYTSNGLYVHFFGEAVSELSERNSTKSFIGKDFVDTSVTVIDSVDKFDTAVLKGFLAKCSEDLFCYAVKCYINDEKLTRIFFRALAARDGDLKSKECIFNWVKENPKWLLFVGDDFASEFNWWYKESCDSVYPFLVKIQNANIYGINALLECCKKIFSFDQERKFDKLEYRITDLLINQYERKPENFPIYAFYDYADMMFRRFSTPMLAKLTNIILIDGLKSGKMMESNSWYKTLYAILTGNYFEDIWPDLLKVLLSTGESEYVYINLMMNIGWMKTLDFGKFEKLKIKPDDALNTLKNKDKLLDSCNRYKDTLPVRLARICPILTENLEITQFMKELVANFGDNIEVLNVISVNLNTVILNGSMVSYYEKQKTIWEEFSTYITGEYSKNWIKNKIDAIDSAIEDSKRIEAEERMMFSD